MNKPKVSVVLPIYNVAPYLEKCLNSIINQTFIDIEIICVNDGSTDNSLAILESYAKKDKRIKIISITNSGVSIARNTGLDAANGKYLYMVDPDDWIEPNTIEILYKKIKKNNAEIVECDFIEHRNFKFDKISKKNLKIHQNIFKKFKIYSGRNYCAKDIKNEIFNIRATCCTKLFNMNFINKYKIRFIEHVLTEDYYFSLEAFLVARKICYINKNLYHYVKRLGSYSNKTSLLTEYQTNIDNIGVDITRIEKILKKHNIENEYEREFKAHKINSLSCEYLYSCNNIKDIFSHHLSEDEYYKFEKITQNNNNSFWQIIFSVSTKTSCGKYYKKILFLGYTFLIPL